MKWKPSRLQIRSPWMQNDWSYKEELPCKELKEEWDAERHMNLILFRFKWGHAVYHLIVNKDDKLELRYMGSNRGNNW